MSKEAMKLALEALENSSADWAHQVKAHQQAITAIKEALAQPEQEPAVGTKTWFEGGKVVTQHLTAKDIYKEPEQEPVAQCTESDSLNCKYCRKTESCKALQAPPYTTPPQRKPLTEEEMEKIATEYWLYPRKFVRAIEAAHGIKE